MKSTRIPTPKILQAADAGFRQQEVDFGDLAQDYITGLIAMGCRVAIDAVTDRSITISAELPEPDIKCYGVVKASKGVEA